MANKVIIDIEARLVDKVSGAAKSAQKGLDGVDKSAQKAKKGLDQLNRTNAKPKISADDSRFTKALNKAQKLANKFGMTKASAMLDAVDRASKKIGGVTSKLKGFTGNFIAKLGINAGNALGTINKVTNGLKGIAGKVWRGTLKVLDAATTPIRKIMNALTSLKTLFIGVAGIMATKQLIINPINLADQYSGAKIGFSTLLGETAGQEMMNEIDLFAKKTPFKTSGVISNVQKMMAYGWDVDRVIDDMETIGDAAAATGKGDQGLESIVYALSEIRSKGKLSTQELNQLASAGIKAKAYLAEGLGYGTDDAGMAKLAKALEKGEVGANKAIDLILEGMKEFDGMMDKTANETVEGLKSQLEDVFEINIARRWGQGLQDGAKRGLGSIVSLLDDADDALNEFGDTIYEVGKKLSNWAADKLENVVQRITDITGSFEFKNASLGEKLKMLWKGVISDPLGEWWESEGRDKTITAAGKIGKSAGEIISTTIKAILGISDIFKEGGMDEVGGMSIAQSFARGFVEGFDVSGITEKLKEAIANVWNALPWWGKVLVGGYAGGKVVTGIGSVIGGIGTIAGALGGTVGTAAAGTGLLGLGANAAIGLGAGNLAGSASLGVGALSAVGLGALVGGIAGGTSLVSGGVDLYKGYKNDDKAKKTTGWWKVGGVGAGAATGAAIGSVIPGLGTAVGALIGAGIGGVAGWFKGNKAAKEIEAATFELKEYGDAYAEATSEAEKAAILEKAIWENQKQHFGDIKLSVDEISRLSNQIVFRDKISDFEKFASATKQAQASYESMKSSAESLARWNWKASLGVKFNDDEKEAFIASAEEYINSAKAYVENKHYEFTAAVSLLIDTKKGAGKDILESGNSYYGKIQSDLEKAGKKLGDKLTEALKDGIISADEQEAITAAQQKIAEITNKISESETSAELELIKIKFGGGQIDSESFANMQTQIQTTIDERMESSDKAFTTTLASLKLQLADGAISQEEYNSQVQALLDGYTASVEKLKAEVKNVQLEIIAESYSDILGENGVEKLNNALTKAIEEGINPKTWTAEEASRLLGVDNLTDETASAIGRYLGAVIDQISSLEVNGNMQVNMDTNMEKITLTPEDFGVKNSYSYNPTVSINPVKSVAQVSLGMSSFGIRNSYTYKPKVTVSPVVKTLGSYTNSFGGSFRGGIEGFSDGGYVKGGGKLIRVAEEGDPEAIIPLSPRRRDRAMSLWEQTGKLLHADFGGGYATGGIVGASETINREPVKISGGATDGPKSIKIEVGGIELNVHVEGGQDVVEAIQNQKEELAEEIAGIIERAISAQYENMPSKRGA